MMHELHLLNDKLDLLIRKYNALQTENKQLNATITQQRKSITSLNDKLASLEHELGAGNVGRTISAGGDRGGMRRQLDSIIGEIDKILHTLND